MQAYSAIYIHQAFGGNLTPDLSASTKIQDCVHGLGREASKEMSGDNNCFFFLFRWAAAEAGFQGSIEPQGCGLCSSTVGELSLPSVGRGYFYPANWAKMITTAAPHACIILLVLISCISIPLHKCQMKAANRVLLLQDATGNEKYCDINKKPVTPACVVLLWPGDTESPHSSSPQ